MPEAIRPAEVDGHKEEAHDDRCDGQQLAADRSLASALFGAGYTQRVELHYMADMWRASLLVHDGVNQDNTGFQAANRPDRENDNAAPPTSDGPGGGNRLPLHHVHSAPGPQAH